MEATPTAAPATYSYRQRRQEAVAASGHRLLHPSLAHLRPEHLVPGLRRLVADDSTPQEGRDGGAALAEDHWTEGVELLHQWRDLHRLRLFSDAFSRQLIEEVEHYLNSPAPKTSEIVLEEIGMQECMRGLVDRVLGPLVARLYPDVAAGLNYHHSFIIRNSWWESDDFQLWRYVDEESGEPTSRHVDDSVVTFNICLGVGDFGGCELRFYGHNKSEDYRRDRYFEYEQVPGVGVIHLGSNEHEVLPMTSPGKRYNLIIWLSPRR